MITAQNQSKGYLVEIQGLELYTGSVLLPKWLI